jgi:hypothetical protein
MRPAAALGKRPVQQLMGLLEVLFADPPDLQAQVERYLAVLRLGGASRRVYRIALATWARTLVGARYENLAGFRTPALPLGVMDGPGAAERLEAAVAQRSLRTSPRTLQREISILKGATAWWQAQGWVARDPAAGLHPPKVGAPSTPLSPEEVGAVFRLAAGLREQALWHVVFDTAAPLEHLLALDVPEIDHAGHRSYWRPTLCWGKESAWLLGLLTLGRVQGPVFLTERRGRAARPEDRCVFTGRGRLSSRRAAELFRAATRPLDDEGRGWSLRRLRAAGRRRG